uniref:Uncharacterized protein n=1 Tax=Caenorhabditis japonica TaxID=281687 RepID=A0A8R1DFF1_CAEJA
MRLFNVLLLFVAHSNACLPTGFGGIFGGGGGGGCASSPGGCGASPVAQYTAPLPSSIYAYTPQVYPQPPSPPPPALAPTREEISFYQGMYQDRPQAPSINPDYRGTAPLNFGSSEDAANTIIDPLKYIEHVSLSHTPTQEVQVPPSPSNPIESGDGSDQKQQIQVAPSSAATEDTYLPGPAEKEKEQHSMAQLNTYYNQMCTGDKIATGEKETINSATKKCELLKCVAANAQPDSNGSYTVTYLKTATSRSNSKGNYCLSMIKLPAKSKRVIPKFDEMMSSEVRRKIFKL